MVDKIIFFQANGGPSLEDIRKTSVNCFLFHFSIKFFFSYFFDLIQILIYKIFWCKIEGNFRQLFFFFDLVLSVSQNPFSRTLWESSWVGMPWHRYYFDLNMEKREYLNFKSIKSQLTPSRKIWFLQDTHRFFNRLIKNGLVKNHHI